MCHPGFGHSYFLGIIKPRYFVVLCKNSSSILNCVSPTYKVSDMNTLVDSL